LLHVTHKGLKFYSFFWKSIRAEVQEKLRQKNTRDKMRAMVTVQNAQAQNRIRSVESTSRYLPLPRVPPPFLPLVQRRHQHYPESIQLLRAAWLSLRAALASPAVATRHSKSTRHGCPTRAAMSANPRSSAHFCFFKYNPTCRDGGPSDRTSGCSQEQPRAKPGSNKVYCQ
jgi:hypothetical protein